GWSEGRTIAIEYRWGEGREERFAEVAAEFVRLKVDVILTTGTLAVMAAKQATSGHLEQYPLSAISALAERGGCSTHAKVSPRSRTVLMPGGRPRGPFARHHADSTRERTQAGEAAIRSS